MTYEYKTVRTEYGHIENILNEHSIDGWDYCDMVCVPSHGEFRYIIIFRRAL